MTYQDLLPLLSHLWQRIQATAAHADLKAVLWCVLAVNIVNGLVCQRKTWVLIGFSCRFSMICPSSDSGKPDVARCEPMWLSNSLRHSWAIRLKGKYHKIAAILFLILFSSTEIHIDAYPWTSKVTVTRCSFVYKAKTSQKNYPVW